MRSISVFGATGSIGESTFDLVMRAGGPAAFRTVALTGGRNVWLVRSGERGFMVVAEWDSLDALAAARSAMVANLDRLRPILEDLGGGRHHPYRDAKSVGVGNRGDLGGRGIF